MGSVVTNLNMSPRTVVLATAAILTAFLLALVAYLWMHDAFASDAAVRALVYSVVAYTVVAALLLRTGLSMIDGLEKLSLTDSLSGVPNRRALHNDIARRAGDGEKVAVAMIDLDGFKVINDHYGHFVGDRLIKEIAGILPEICDGEAGFYRLGGDEFALVAFGPIANNILESACRRLLQRLARPVSIEERQIVIGASIGMSHRSEEMKVSSSELLRRADVAMYASKAGGKMRCTWFSEDFDRSRDQQRQVESELRQAIEEEEFFVHYQPLVDADSGAIVAVEALLRWDRGDREPIGPNIFIPIAEETGLINPIGRWVLRQACIDALRWDGIKLSVNVSAAQLRNPEFPIQLGHILEETGFPPERLELEITETYLVGDPQIAGRAMEMIRSFGVGVALDDFGTGYASIGFLRKFRFEKLKLDRSLIVGAADDDSSKAMMISSIAVARAMNMGVTAEGIETDDQATIARLAGCDQMQGWLYYKSLGPEEIDELLKDMGTPAKSKHKKGERVA